MEGPQANNAIGRIMLILAFILCLILLTRFFNGVLEDQRNPNQQVMTTLSPEGVPEVVLQQNRYGHYIASGSINGVKVDFLLDTGATGVAIPAKLAGTMNLKPGPEIEVSTANGIVLARMTRLDRVDLGEISLRNIQATIIPHMQADDEVLLGMSFLKQLELIQRDNTLILRQYNKQI